MFLMLKVIFLVMFISCLLKIFNVEKLLLNVKLVVEFVRYLCNGIFYLNLLLIMFLGNSRN